MQRTYELMFIVRPDMLEEDQDKLISNVETQVGNAGGMVKEVERRLRVTEPVIKFITVRVDEEQKRLAKIKAIRDTKVRGKGRQAAAAAAAAEATASAEEATPESAPPAGTEPTPLIA